MAESEAIEKATAESSNRFVRYAARVAIEKQAVSDWEESLAKRLAAVRPSLARISKAAELQSAMIDKLAGLNFSKMDKSQKLAAIRAYQLVFTRTGPYSLV